MDARKYLFIVATMRSKIDYFRDMDTISKEKRSQVMSKVKQKDTKPEVYFRKLLFARGYRYRLHSKKIAGKPDLYLAKYNTVIFINGCFWHRHTSPECKLARLPKSRLDYWIPKLNRNVERDKETLQKLLESGYKVLIIWECTVKKMQKNEDFAKEVLLETKDFLYQSEQRYMEL